MLQVIEQAEFMKIALGNVLNGFRYRLGEPFVFSVGADIHTPVVLLVVAGFAAAGGFVVDFGGVDQQCALGLNFCTFSAKAVVGVDGQVALCLNIAGLRSAFAAAVLSLVVGNFDTIASTLDAACVIETAASGSGVAVFLLFVVRSQQLDIFPAQVTFTGRSL
ncbi:hypothetical protein D3C81_1383530 [compost metagenome]